MSANRHHHIFQGLIKRVAHSRGHIGLFMGAKTLRETWPDIGRWLRAHDRG